MSVGDRDRPVRPQGMQCRPASGTVGPSGDAGGIVVAGLSFSYGRGTRRSDRGVLRDVSLSAPQGTVTAVVGPNGSGKSTLLKLISAYLRPAKGSIIVNRKNPFALSPAERARLVTYCGDDPEPAFEFTVEETVLMGRIAAPVSTTRGYEEDARAAARAMQEVGVYDLRDRTITSLSSGERQRVYIARAICQDPEVFLLDEPTAHLDMAYELQIMDLIVRMALDGGKTALAVVHDLNLALRYASRLFFLKDGVVECSMEPAQVTAEVIQDVYGVQAQVEMNAALGCPVVIPGRAVRQIGPR